MNNVAIVTDSVACVPQALLSRFGIHVIPVRISSACRMYCDKEEELSGTLIHTLQEADSIDTTPWPPEHYCRQYEKIAVGVRDIVHVVPFARFTSTISLSKAGAMMAQERVPGLRVEIVDSLTTTMGQGLVALEAARAASEGYGIDDVLVAAERIRSKVGGIYTFDSLHHLARTGRINALASWASSILSIRPVVGLWAGREHPVGLARSRAAAIRKVADSVCQRLAGVETPQVVVQWSGRSDEAEELLAAIRQRIHAPTAMMVQVSPVTQIVAGPSLLGVAYCRQPSSW